MYRDSHTPGSSWWHQVLRALNASFPVGGAFGVQVRMFWIAAILMPLLAYREVAELTRSVGQAWILAFAITISLYAVVWSHEMGHIIAGWRYRVRTKLITLSPLGGIAHMGAPVPGPRADVVVSVAGPVVHLPWLAILWPLSYWVDPWVLTADGLRIDTAGFLVLWLRDLNLWLMLFNLMPFFPLDGGRIARAVLAMRIHPNKATYYACQVGRVGAVGFVLVGLGVGISSTWGIILVLIGVSNYLACRQELLAVRHTEGPYVQGEPLALWQNDPDAWKHGGVAAAADEDKHGGMFDGAGERRRERTKARRKEAESKLDEDLDRVLARISEVGMDGLTSDEREILDRASKAKHKA